MDTPMGFLEITIPGFTDMTLSSTDEAKPFISRFQEKYSTEMERPLMTLCMTMKKLFILFLFIAIMGLFFPSCYFDKEETLYPFAKCDTDERNLFTNHCSDTKCKLSGLSYRREFSKYCDTRFTG